MIHTAPSDVATLQFDRQHVMVGEDTDIRRGLSAVALDAEHLWLACDEGCRLERLSRTGPGLTFSHHRIFPLEDVLALPAGPTEEADVEGLDIDDGWLWLVGSHSIKRSKPKPDDSPKKAAKRLAETGRDGNRHLLARLPLVRGVPERKAGARRAASIKSSSTSSALLDAIKRDDAHLAPFVPLPGKDNGLDIEGLAVRGMRAFVGLRGPVLREWCCILELRVEADGKRLRLAPLDGRIPYRKHFLQLNGLGVRDLLVMDDDVFILTGPSMAHDGPNEIWRWTNGAKEGAASHDATRLLVLPPREGHDRAEGFTFIENGQAATSVLVVFDTPAETRLSGESVSADVFTLG